MVFSFFKKKFLEKKPVVPAGPTFVDIPLGTLLLCTAPLAACCFACMMQGVDCSSDCRNIPKGSVITVVSRPVVYLRSEFGIYQNIIVLSGSSFVVAWIQRGLWNLKVLQ